jgi:hypothetical protein
MLYFSLFLATLLMLFHFATASFDQPAYAEALADGINFRYRYSLCQKKSLSR